MKPRSQSGQTLVELLIGITVAGMVLATLAGLLYSVSDRFSRWGGRLDTATDGFGLASALQADSHRYVPCHPDVSDELQFCQPTAGCPQAVSYSSQPLRDIPGTSLSRGTYAILRTEGGKSAVVGRALAEPQFRGGGGVISVSGISPSLNLVVYYAPVLLCR